MDKNTGLFATKLCGSDYYQVLPGARIFTGIDALAKKLGNIGEVTRVANTLRCKCEKYDIIVFGDGRAMIRCVPDAETAKAVYAEYIG